jgi:IclR family acetate operon transcriptional repressor
MPDSPIICIDKALLALERLGEMGAGGLGITRLAADLGLNKGSLHRTLSALRHRGFVDQDDVGNYRLGSRILVLANSYLRNEHLRNVMHEPLTDLCRQVNETCHIGVLIEEDIIYIDKIDPERPVRTWSVIGWRNPAVLTALGRAMLGQRFIDFASFAARFPSAIEKRTAFTKTSREAIWQELLDSRERGFALEHQEYILGVGCIAKAILRGPEVIAAISITVPAHRLDMKSHARLARALDECITPHLPPGLSLQKPIRQKSLRPRRIRKATPALARR